MMTRRQSIFLGVASVFVVFLFVFSGRIVLRDFFQQSDLSIVSLDQEEFVLVSRVIDGDTVELENGERVRYIGVNAPESVDPRRKVECFGKEAAAFHKNLAEGKRIRLERDVSDRDRYGRLLRFAYLEDGTFVNEMLVREGYAHATPYVPDISKKEFFREVEEDARAYERGLWNPLACSDTKKTLGR